MLKDATLWPKQYCILKTIFCNCGWLLAVRDCDLIAHQFAATAMDSLAKPTEDSPEKEAVTETEIYSDFLEQWIDSFIEGEDDQEGNY